MRIFCDYVDAWIVPPVLNLGNGLGPRPYDSRQTLPAKWAATTAQN